MSIAVGSMLIPGEARLVQKLATFQGFNKKYIHMNHLTQTAENAQCDGPPLNKAQR